MRTSDLSRAVRAAWLRLRVLAALVAAWSRELARRLRPWPTVEPRPFPCVACNVEYSDPRALGWHMHGHAEDVTVAPDIAAALRRAGDRRRQRRALEELDLC